MKTLNLFSEIPENFFSPLASKNRHHYSSLLLIYYQLFSDYHGGIEREIVVSRFEEYFTNESNRATISFDEEQGEEVSETDEDSEISDDKPSEAAEVVTPRTIASYFLRRLILFGWISEEILADYTQVINMCSWARPFFSAMAQIVQGVDVEYESHIVGIYSSLCSEALQDNGHHAVLNALDHTRKLIESLKILSQNIKTHLDKVFHFNSDIKELLHIHYDLYMNEIVDKAYNRLKTSDNLSKYRPVINSALVSCQNDEVWLQKSALKLAVIKNIPKDNAYSMLISMLKEIRDELRNIDPILEEIDDKNRQYSRISTEKVKAHLYADASLQGKVQQIIQYMRNNPNHYNIVQNRLLSVGFLNRDSLYKRPVSRDIEIVVSKQAQNEFETEFLDTCMFMKIHNQLNPEKISVFLDQHCNSDGSPAPAENMIETMQDYIKVMYASLYCENRAGRFAFRVHWQDETVTKGCFVFKKHSFMRANTRKHQDS